MASLAFPAIPLLPCNSKSPFSFFPKLPFNYSCITVRTLNCSSSKGIPLTEQELLQAVVESDEKNLPCVRTYENDLSRLTLVGAVDFQQALTAAAADGGEAATEHIDSGMSAMVVETVYPGSSNERSTVSTRLFLPARKVKEKAMKLRRSLSEDILSSANSVNILAMTFRQVILWRQWSFELVIFGPGRERNMEDLENARQVHPSFTLSSSDDYLISMLAQAVCISSLQSTEKQFINNLQGTNSSGFLSWLGKPPRILSSDSSVALYHLNEEEIVENARNLLEYYNAAKDTSAAVLKSKQSWWRLSSHLNLEKIGGSDLSAWVSEHVPVYKLEIDTNRIKDAKFEGWKKSGQKKWEVLLTHSQMVGLADTLDMYYEDKYSLPDKVLDCSLPVKHAKLPTKKVLWNSSFMQTLSVIVAGGIFLAAASVFNQLFVTPLLRKGIMHKTNDCLPPSEVDFAQHQLTDASKLEEYCISIIEKIKEGFGWSGDVKKEDGIGIWIGHLPIYLRTPKLDNSDNGKVPHGNVSDLSNTEVSAQDIASYQVVLSSDGKIIGFQPLSRVAVNHWVTNPLAKELYKGRKLSPGLIEPGLKVPVPSEVAVLELLMSVKQEACFALVRPNSELLPGHIL